MKIKFFRRDATGHVLVTTLVVAAVLGIALGAFLHLLTGQLNQTVRAQVWNDCMPVVEGGIEEALAHMNTTLCTNLNTDGWSFDAGAGAFTKTRNWGDNYAVVQIFTNGGSDPYIISQGHVPAPVTVSSGGEVFAAVGPTPGLTYISRKVKVTTKREPAFKKALVVKSIVDFRGNNVLIDSYDSSLGPYSAQTPGDKGDVFCNSDLKQVTGNAKIKGHVTTGPNGFLNPGPNCSIGSAGWVNVPTRGVEDGWWRKDANLYIPDVAPPWNAGAYTPPVGVGINKYVLETGNYEVPGDLVLRSGESMLVKGDATLWVRGNTFIAGDVRMNGAGHRLTIYSSGNVNCTGTWVKSIHPEDLIIYGLPTCRAVAVATGMKLECVLYAPNAYTALIGTANFFGCITVDSVMMNGNTAFHYDENLNKYPAWRGYIPASWVEL